MKALSSVMGRFAATSAKPTHATSVRSPLQRMLMAPGSSPLLTQFVSAVAMRASALGLRLEENESAARLGLMAAIAIAATAT